MWLLPFLVIDSVYVLELNSPTIECIVQNGIKDATD